MTELPLLSGGRRDFVGRRASDADIRPLAHRLRRALAAAASAARPRQWTKNLLLFGGLVFANRIGDPVAWLAATLAALAFCAASSAAYLVNDIRDVAADRLHPVKKLRPIASGRLARRPALGLAVGLQVAGLALAVSIGPDVVGFVVAFTALQAAYTLGLKRIAFVDVIAIACLFVLRAAAGAAAVDVRISPWLLACTALLALFLGLTKRRAELILVRSGRAPGRAALAQYPLGATNGLIRATAGGIAVVYTLYGLLGSNGPVMVATAPLVGFGLARYLHLSRTRDIGEEPDRVLLGDLPLLLCVAGWTLVAAAIVAR